MLCWKEAMLLPLVVIDVWPEIVRVVLVSMHTWTSCHQYSFSVKWPCLLQELHSCLSWGGGWISGLHSSAWSSLQWHVRWSMFGLLHYSIPDSLVPQSVPHGTVHFLESCSLFLRLERKYPNQSGICAVTHTYCYNLTPYIIYHRILLTPDIKEDRITWSTSNIITDMTRIISIICSSNVWLLKCCAIYLPSMAFQMCTIESPFHREIIGIAVCMAKHSDSRTLHWCWWTLWFKWDNRCIWRRM